MGILPSAGSNPVGLGWAWRCFLDILMKLATSLSGLSLEQSFLKVSLQNNRLESSFQHRFLLPRVRFHRWGLMICIVKAPRRVWLLVTGLHLRWQVSNFWANLVEDASTVSTVASSLKRNTRWLGRLLLSLPFRENYTADLESVTEFLWFFALTVCYFD